LRFLGYSKKIEYLKHSAALLIAYFNFCCVRGAHQQTPAMVAGLANHVWTIKKNVQTPRTNDLTEHN